MLGEKIYSLRKNRKISQEEFAEILNTSRQNISKWERNESKPDIDKLIIIARLFNVSIDYLLSYEINFANVDNFLDRLKVCCKKNEFIIDINDIRLWCSKYTNNFELHICSAEYLLIAYIDNNNAEYLDLALSCITKAIILFSPEYNETITLNDLHKGVISIYIKQQKYELAKEYLLKNKVYGCNELLAKCDLALKNYDDALEVSSDIYLKSVSDIINSLFIEIMVLLKKKQIQESYELVNWVMDFIKSIKNDDIFFNGILCPFLYLKATCEKLLNIDNKDTIQILKNINNTPENKKITAEIKTMKYYFGQSDSVLLNDTTIKNMFNGIIGYISKEDIHYEVLVNIYKEILGDNYYE